MADKFISTAKVIDGILVLSLPDAINPVVWQMELGQSKSSALEVRPQADSTFMLTLKTPRQDVLDIAVYAERSLAIKALLTVSQALEKAQGQMRQDTGARYGLPVPSYTEKSSHSPLSLLKTIFKILFGAVGVVLALFILTFLIGNLLGRPSSTTTAERASMSSQQNVPVSADDFLEGR